MKHRPGERPETADSDLFREAMRGVRPLPQEPRPANPRKAPARARFTRADRRAVLEESLTTAGGDPALAGGEELVFRRPGVSDRVLRKLRRGAYRVQTEIDLHGLTAVEAKRELRDFLAEALARNTRCVRVVHGKGLRSGHRGPVLKATVNDVLRRHQAVLAFVSARSVDGGTGALYVLLAP